MSVNKAILVGRLGADPELRTSQRGRLRGGEALDYKHRLWA